MGMQYFKAVTAEPVEGTVHVALLDGEGAIIIHEEIPAAAAWHRNYMLEGQALVDAAAGQDRQVYKGEVWPPAGHEIQQGKVVPVKAEE